MGEEFVSDDEFHETFEDIATGSDEGSEGGGDRATPVWSPSAFESKFSVWKDGPGSINERRQRFFREMGLKSSRDEHGYARVAALTAGKRSRNPEEEGEEDDDDDDDDDEHVKPTCEKCGGERKRTYPQPCAHAEAVHIENVENECESDPDHGPNHEENFAEKCSREEEPPLKSSSRSKLCDCADSNCTERCGELIANSSASSSSSELHHHQASSSQETLSSPESLIEEERLKIRDLDSGKEFLMKRFNRDGSLNMLREVATGKDLTVAEFEKTLGLFSPVAQELHRRERFGEKPEPQSTDSKPAAHVTKRKSWLKRLRGALKAGSKPEGGSARSVATYDSLEDTDPSSLGSSPMRESSFAGSDQNEFTKRRSVSGEGVEGAFWRKPQKVKVKVRQKSARELSDLHMSQEILVHQGAIWTMKFSPDGRYLASAGQDRVVHVWEVVDHPLMADSDHWGGSEKGDGEVGSFKGDNDGSVKGSQDRSMTKEGSTRSGKGTPRKQKSGSRSKGPVPKLFWLSEKPMCSFRGHTDDILDLSWSRSQFLLSSSMDKTVRLWHISDDECLRIFSHNDYVTCAQFNPLDDRYFLSGSLDDKVRIWSIPDHHVVDWSDLQEMVTAVSYTPDGKKAIVGSYKGTCRFYNASGNKLQLEAHIDVREESKKARGKKITGLHCMPGDPQKVLVTSNDSRIRVYDGLDLVAKYKGLRNVKSQISSSFSPSGDFILSASEDSRVLLWNATTQEASHKPFLYRRDKQLAYEEFTSKHVSVAIAWPSSSSSSSSPPPPPPLEKPEEKEHHPSSKCPTSSCLGRSPLGIFGSGRKSSVAVADELTSTKQVGAPSDESFSASSPWISSVFPEKSGESLSASSPWKSSVFPDKSGESFASSSPWRSSFFPECGPKGSATTWPEEKLGGGGGDSSREVVSGGDGVPSPAWGLVIVTAGLGGEITTFQNYGFPVRL